MALIAGFTKVDVTAVGRTVLKGRQTRTDREAFEFAILTGGTLGTGNTLRLDVSYEDVPAAATDAHWATVDSLDFLAIGYMYRVDVFAPTIAIRVIGSNTPDFDVVVK